MKDFGEKVKGWATDRNLHTGDPNKQMLKLFEELGELAGAMARNKVDVIKDSVGDIDVVLEILCMQLGINRGDCQELAYNEIKDRKGKLINGVFIKEEDLIKMTQNEQ